jgi:hypothetical protein
MVAGGIEVGDMTRSRMISALIIICMPAVGAAQQGAGTPLPSAPEIVLPPYLQEPFIWSSSPARQDPLLSATFPFRIDFGRMTNSYLPMQMQMYDTSGTSTADFFSSPAAALRGLHHMPLPAVKLTVLEW